MMQCGMMLHSVIKKILKVLKKEQNLTCLVPTFDNINEIFSNENGHKNIPMLIIFNTLSEPKKKKKSRTHTQSHEKAIYSEMFSHTIHIAVPTEINTGKNCNCDGNSEINNSFFE